MMSGARAITYGLYRNPARTEGWGELTGSTVEGTGTGDTVRLPIYGRVPPQIAGPGAYSDTVVVNIFYD
jgi:spore coat protein U-like protein